MFHSSCEWSARLSYARMFLWDLASLVDCFVYLMFLFALFFSSFICFLLGDFWLSDSIVSCLALSDIAQLSLYSLLVLQVLFVAVRLNWDYTKLLDSRVSASQCSAVFGWNTISLRRSTNTGIWLRNNFGSWLLPCYRLWSSCVCCACGWSLIIVEPTVISARIGYRKTYFCTCRTAMSAVGERFFEAEDFCCC